VYRFRNRCRRCDLLFGRMSRYGKIAACVCSPALPDDPGGRRKVRDNLKPVADIQVLLTAATPAARRPILCPMAGKVAMAGSHSRALQAGWA